ARVRILASRGVNANSASRQTALATTLFRTLEYGDRARPVNGDNKILQCGTTECTLGRPVHHRGHVLVKRPVWLDREPHRPHGVTADSYLRYFNHRATRQRSDVLQNSPLRMALVPLFELRAGKEARCPIGRVAIANCFEHGFRQYVRRAGVE